MTSTDLQRADPNIQQMGSLLARMTGDRSEQVKFTKTQVNSIIEVLLPRLATTMPGLPDGMLCHVDKTSEDSWTLTITRPV
jgi:hypothetical protein